MLKCSFIGVHPQFIDAYRAFGVFRAAEALGIEIQVINLRDFGSKGRVDDRPYGGGDSMVLQAPPLAAAWRAIQPDYTIYSSPKGRYFRQEDAQQLKELDGHLAFVCGRFGGVDQRFLDKYVDVEYSLGDFVMSGGELAALTIADAVLRLVPGVLGNPVSAVRDSFAQGGEVEAALYTRPPVFEGAAVPAALLSGDHQAIASWRLADAKSRQKK